MWNTLLNQCQKHKHTILFGCSITNRRLFAVLERNGIVVDAFCDNEEEKWGTKSTGEGVYVKNMLPHFNVENPRLSFPFYNRKSDAYFCPIRPEYHTSLLPDSILNNESTRRF